MFMQTRIDIEIICFFAGFLVLLMHKGAIALSSPTLAILGILWHESHHIIRRRMTAFRGAYKNIDKIESKTPRGKSSFLPITVSPILSKP